MRFSRVRVVVALLFVGAVARGDEGVLRCVTGKSLKPTTCEITLAPHDYRLPLVFVKSSTPAVIGPGVYDVRAGAPGLSLETNTTFSVVSPEGTPHGVLLHLVPGGEVALAPQLVPPHGVVELLSLSTGRVDVLFLDRENSTPFPAGDTIALGVAEPGTNVGLTRPWQLRTREKRIIQTFDQPTRGTGHLLVSAQYPSGRDLKGMRDLDFGIQRDARTLSSRPYMSDKAISTAYGVFYDVPAGQYGLGVTSQYWWAPARKLIVKAGEIAVDEQISLLEKPKLTLRVEADPSLDDRPQKATVYQCKPSELGPGTSTWPSMENCKPIREAVFKGHQVQIPFLELDRFFVKVQVGSHQLGRQVDLHAGNDVEETFEFKESRLSGMVTRGGKGTSSSINFQNLDSETQETEAQSDAEGKYEASFWSRSDSGFEARLLPQGADADKAVSILFRLDQPSAEVRQDFELPFTTIRVTVTEEGMNRPIKGAEVYCEGYIRTTNEDGQVSLPPIPPGPMRCSSRAKRHIEQRTTFDVIDTDAKQTFEIVMKSTRGTAVSVLLPSGEPAVGADAFIGYGSDAVNGMGSHIQCDDEGICEIGDESDDATPVYFFHPRAALTVASLGQLGHTLSITLDPPGGEARIRLRSTTRTGTEIVMGSVSLGGVPVPNGITRFVGSRDITILGQNLPLIYNGLPGGDVGLTVYSIGTTDSNSAGQSPPSPRILLGPVPIHIPSPETELDLP